MGVLLLDLDPVLAKVLQSSHEVEFRVQASRGADVTVESVPVTGDGDLTFNASGEVECTGSVFVAGDSDSLVPKSKTDPLAPFGQELRISRVDKGAGREWVTPLGQLRIVQATEMQEKYRLFPSRALVVGWSVRLDVADRFEAIRADGFLDPDGPQRDRSTWDEIQRLSPFPIVRTGLLPDRAVPLGLAYPESRLEAITMLFNNLGGVPHLLRTGELSGRVKDSWLTATEPVHTIDGVIDMDDSLSNDLFNAVRVKSSAGDNNLVKVEQILDRGNPINIYDMGRRTYKFDSPLLTTQQAVNAAAGTVLARVSARASRSVRVTFLPNPCLELGDYIRARDTTSGREVVGEIKRMSHPLNSTGKQTIELIVAETR